MRLLPQPGDAVGSGLVLVYMGPDGTDVDEYWATINGNNYHGNVAKTLCQQLGYDMGTATTPPSQEVKYVFHNFIKTLLNMQ